MQIRPISLDREDLAELSEEALREGFGFLERLARDWITGSNRFADDGELLLGAFDGQQLIAVGGLNRDPYDRAPGVARLRHLYVLKGFRRRGTGTKLVRALRVHAGRGFAELRLRTDRAEAAAFYEKLGFERVAIGEATHRLYLAPVRGSCP